MNITRFPHVATDAQPGTIRYAAAIERPAPRSRMHSALMIVLWLLVVLAAFAAVAISLRQLPVADNSAEWAQVAAVEAERRAQDQAVREQRAARTMCASDHGPNVEAIWLNAHSVECVNTRGRRLSGFSMEVSHAQ